MFSTLTEQKNSSTQLVEIYDSMHPDQNHALVTSSVTDSSDTFNGSYCIDDHELVEIYFNSYRQNNRFFRFHLLVFERLPLDFPETTCIDDNKPVEQIQTMGGLFDA